MRKYIPLSIFKELFENQADLVLVEGISRFKIRLQKSGLAIAEKSGFNRGEFLSFQQTLDTPSNIVFYGWIEQQKELSNILLGKRISTFEDRSKHLEHKLVSEYRKFISPY
jgi:hypothetical protein